MGVRELVGAFTTPYACCQPRVTNIQRAARILDRTIVPAGGTFSLNTALGERTRARGFVPAPQIIEGRLEDAVGGGVSQMATTVYNAAFFSGVEIVTHQPHEFWITRYPAGREATVSWGGPELIFRNDWDAAILMTVTATDTSLTVRMYSSPLGRRVATATTGDEPVEGAAFTVTTTRKVWRGTELRRDESFRWSYKAPPAGE
jgi:vancomycin resistance protein YoaR